MPRCAVARRRGISTDRRRLGAGPLARPNSGGKRQTRSTQFFDRVIHRLLRSARRDHAPIPAHRRMEGLGLLDDGGAAERVAEVLFIDVETVRESRRLQRGLSG